MPCLAWRKSWRAVLMPVSILCVVFFVFSAPRAVKASGNICHCEGTLKANFLQSNSAFDQSCPSLGSNCSQCGGGSAACKIDLTVTSQADCDVFSKDGSQVAAQLGWPDSAPTPNADGMKCTYTGGKSETCNFLCKDAAPGAPINSIAGSCSSVDAFGDAECQTLCDAQCGAGKCRSPVCVAPGNAPKSCDDGSAKGIALQKATNSDPANWSCQSMDGVQGDAVSQFCFTSAACLSNQNFYCCVPGAAAKGASCKGQVDPEEKAVVLKANPGADESTMTCQDVDLSDPNQASKCVTTIGCPGQLDNIKCCLPNTGKVAGAVGGGAVPAPAPWWAQDVSACFKTGNCSLDDIVRVAAAFANYLFLLSGAVALLVLVYGGVRYLWAGTPGGGEEDIKKGKAAITGAAIGLIIIFTAHTLIRFVVSSITSPTGGAGSCAEQNAGFVCQVVKDTNKDAPDAAGCKPEAGLCDAGFKCCPSEPANPPPKGKGK